MRKNEITAKHELWLIGCAWEFPLAVERLQQLITEKEMVTITRVFNQRKSNPKATEVLLQILTEGRVIVTQQELLIATVSKLKENLAMALRFVEASIMARNRRSQTGPLKAVQTVSKKVPQSGDSEERPFIFSQRNQLTEQWNDAFYNFVIPSRRPVNNQAT